MDAGSSTRRAAAGVAALLLISVLTTIAPAPAGAIDVATGTTDVSPVTWVDGTHRQYVLMSAGTSGDLQIARDTASGTPDATWGTFRGRKGLRQLVVAAPASGATMQRLAAVAADGTITTVWDAASCASPTATCDRWFARVSPTGAAVGAPVLRTGTAPPLRALTDGSFVTGTGSGAIGWRSPTGVDQGAPALTASTLRGAAVDGGGRLLVTSTGGAVTRWPVGGPADLTFTTTCTGTEGLAIGAPLANDGFATACGAASAAQVVTTRYEGDGQVRWTTTGVPADRATMRPGLVTVDSSDHVWIAGQGTVSNGGSNVPIATLAEVGPSQDPAPAGAGYQRWRQGIGTYDIEPSGITDLRPALGDHVAFADLQNCCQYRWGPFPSDSVIGKILPTPVTTPAVPTCAPRHAKIIAATRTTTTVSFQGCSAGAGGPAPTGYLIEDRNYYNPSATTTGLPSSPDATLTATLTASSPPGAAVYVSSINGDGVGAEVPYLFTFLPFRNYDEYIRRQFVDLMGHAPSAAEHTDALQNWVYSHSANALIEHLIGSGTGRAITSVEPIARLYRAYFLRDADISGLRYWVGKREAGATLGRISEQFARSSEFTRRYGALGNRAFVERIYSDVLGRAGDPTGIDFWTRQLDTGRKNRGAVMVNFSESSEYVTKTARNVQPVSAFFLMLGRLPTPADSALVADWRREVVAYAAYQTAEYDGLVP